MKIVVLFLRITLGLNFFYLGFADLFNQPLQAELGKRSLGSLYAWTLASGGAGSFHILLPWVFLIIGVCLILGLTTRFMSIAAIAIIFVNYLPNLALHTFSIAQFINDEVIVILCLLIIIFSNAGHFLGLDTFIRMRRRSKHKMAK